MKFSKFLSKKIRNYSESAEEVDTKLSELTSEVDELKESEDSIMEFSKNTKSKLKKLLKKFSEVEEVVNEANTDSEELEKAADEFNDESIKRTVKVVKKEFARLKKEFSECKDELSKLSEISGIADTDEKLSTSDKVPTDPIESAKPEESDSSSPEVPTDSLDSADTDEKKSITNFSKLITGKFNRLFSKFGEVLESMETINDMSYRFSEELEEVTEDDTLIENKDLELMDTKLDINAPEEVSAVAIKIGNFAEEVTKEVIEAVKEGKLGEDDLDKAKECFAELAESLDDVCEEYNDETTDKVIDKVEKCKECIAGFAKKSKFSIKKRFGRIIENFAELDSMIDEVAEVALHKEDIGTPVTLKKSFEQFCDEIKEGIYDKEEVMTFCNKFCDATGMNMISKDVEFCNGELNDKIDELEVIEDKVKDETIVQFSKKVRKAMKSMKCFSEEDLEEKTGIAEELAEMLDNEVESSEKIEEADKELNEKIDDLEKVEEKVVDEKLKSFSKMLRKAMKSMKCFSEEDLEEKTEQVADLAESLDSAVESESTKEEEVVEETTDDVKSETEEVTEEFSDEIEEEVVEETTETEEVPSEEVIEEQPSEEVIEEVTEEFSDEDEDSDEDDDDEDEEESEDSEESTESELMEVPSEEVTEEEVVEETTETEEPSEEKSALMDESEIDESIVKNFSKKNSKRSAYASILLG